MKIGIIAHLKHPIREPFAGGLEMHTYAICNALRQRGHDVTLFAAAGSSENIGLKAIRGEVGNPGLGTADEFREEHRIYLRLMEDLHASDFDIIHNNSLHYLPVALAGTLPMPMVTVLHTPPFWEMEGGIKRNPSSNSHFIAVSSYIRDLWTPITSVNRVIYNGIDLGKFTISRHPAPTPYLAWSGRIVPEKGLHLALRAAQQAGMNLRIAGPISDRLYFERAIRPLLGQRACYVGHLNQSDVANLIGGARAFLFTPLWDEPYGLVLAEALACGTPVASFARGAVGEILDDTCGVIVPSDDVAALARAAHDAQHLSRRHCRKRAEKIANSGNMISQYEAFYRQLISGRTPAAAIPFLPGSFPEPPNSRALLDHYLYNLPAMSSNIPPGLRP